MRKRYITLLFAALSLLLPSSAAGGGLLAGERAVLSEINRVRAARGLAPLRIDWRLQRAARAHTTDMLRRDYFSHGAFALRMRRYAVRGPRTGENLAWGAGSRAAARSIVRMWLHSASHRANLLRPGFRRVGVGSRVGSFVGVSRARVVTADFAGR